MIIIHPGAFEKPTGSSLAARGTVYLAQPFPPPGLTTRALPPLPEREAGPATRNPADQRGSKESTASTASTEQGSIAMRTVNGDGILQQLPPSQPPQPPRSAQLPRRVQPARPVPLPRPLQPSCHGSGGDLAVTDRHHRVSRGAYARTRAVGAGE